MLNRLTLPTELESRAIIQFQDCDPMGHLNNARYLHYFFNARESQVATAYGMRFSDAPRQFGKTWVVRTTRIAYLSPALYDEEVRIRTRIIDARKNGLVVEALMLDGAGRRLKSLSWAEFASIDVRTGRPTSHADAWQELVDTVRYTDYQFVAAAFDERVAAVAKEVKQAYRSGAIEREAFA